MSQENLEIARLIIELANRGDTDGIAALMSPDIKCVPEHDQPDSKPFWGRNAFAAYAKGWQEVFDHWAIEPTEFLDLGEYVIVVGQILARGHGSGAELSDEDAWLFRFRDGLAIEYWECRTKEKALEVAGLQE